MFGDVIDLLNTDPVDQLTRPHLHDRFNEVRRLEGALAAYKARLVNATDGLGDKGLDGAGMLRSAGRMSAKSAGALAATAGKLELLPRTAEALADGRLTIEDADAIARASDATSPEAADAALVPDVAAPPADVFAKRSREWVSARPHPAGPTRPPVSTGSAPTHTGSRRADGSSSSTSTRPRAARSRAGSTR